MFKEVIEEQAKKGCMKIDRSDWESKAYLDEPVSTETLRSYSRASQARTAFK